MIKDLELKQRIAKEGLYKDFKKLRFDLFRNNDIGALHTFLKDYGKDVYRVCDNIRNNKKRKRQKCYEKVRESILSGNAYFATLTFDDDTLAKTSEKTRRVYVSRFLKSVCYKYVANIDYGDKNGREHYHAIVEVYPWCYASYQNGKVWYEDMPDFREWCYGFFSLERIGSDEMDLSKIAMYVCKLTSHALKKSTLQGCASPRLIYSR